MFKNSEKFRERVGKYVVRFSFVLTFLLLFGIFLGVGFNIDIFEISIDDAHKKVSASQEYVKAGASPPQDIEVPNPHNAQQYNTNEAIALMTENALSNINNIVIATSAFFSAMVIAFGIYQWQSSSQLRSNLDEIYSNKIGEAVEKAKKDIGKETLERTQEIYKKNEEVKQEMELQTLILQGKVYRISENEDRTKAIETYLELIEKIKRYNQQEKDKYNIHTYYLEIAEIYDQLENFNKSNEYYEEARKDQQYINDPDILGAIANNLENKNNKERSLERARDYLEKALLYKEEDIQLNLFKYELYSQLISRLREIPDEYKNELHKSIKISYSKNPKRFVGEVLFNMDFYPNRTYFKKKEELIEYLLEHEIEKEENIQSIFPDIDEDDSDDMFE